MNFCSSCGTKLSSGANFCPGCGVALSGTPTQATPVQPSQFAQQSPNTHSDVAERAGEMAAAAVTNLGKGAAQLKRSFGNLQKNVAEQNVTQKGQAALSSLSDSTMRLIIIALAVLLAVSTFMPFVSVYSRSINFAFPAGEVGDGIFVIIGMVVIIVLTLLESSRPRRGMRIASLVIAIIPLLLFVHLVSQISGHEFGSHAHYSIGFWLAVLLDIALIFFLVLYLLRFKTLAPQAPAMPSQENPAFTGMSHVPGQNVPTAGMPAPAPTPMPGTVMPSSPAPTQVPSGSGEPNAAGNTEQVAVQPSTPPTPPPVPPTPPQAPPTPPTPPPTPPNSMS